MYFINTGFTKSQKSCVGKVCLSIIHFPLLFAGEIQYRQRIEDIRLLKLEIKKLRREKHILTKSVSNVEELRREVYNMQRELLRERTRCKALEEELENPMNIHRWRKLEVGCRVVLLSFFSSPLKFLA